MMDRGLDKEFLKAMEIKLQYGREKGRIGWDRHWKRTVFPTNDPAGYLLDCLNQEVLELTLAIKTGTKEEIKFEAADVANFAMMVADYMGGLED